MERLPTINITTGKRGRREETEEEKKGGRDVGNRM